MGCFVGETALFMRKLKIKLKNFRKFQHVKAKIIV